MSSAGNGPMWIRRRSGELAVPRGPDVSSALCLSCAHLRDASFCSLLPEPPEHSGWGFWSHSLAQAGGSSSAPSLATLGATGLRPCLPSFAVRYT